MDLKISIFLKISRIVLVTLIVLSIVLVVISSLEILAGQNAISNNEEIICTLIDGEEVDCNIDEINNQNMLVSNITPNLVGIIYLMTLAFVAKKLLDLMNDYKNNEIFTKKTILNIQKIGVALILIPLFFTIIKETLLFFNYNLLIFQSSPILSGFSRGLRDLSILDFNLSTIFLGIIVFFLVEVIQKGVEYKDESDLTI